MNGQEMYALAQRLFPICRSLTGDGVRETLRILQEYLPALELHEVPTGTQAFDWTVPDEWNIRDGWIKNERGETVVSFTQSNLHIMGYSEPVDRVVTREELLQYVHVLEDQPTLVPYVTSYYKRRFGFCMSKQQRDALPEGRYHMYIDSTLAPGSMTYGELVIPATEGEDAPELLFSTYVCHPSMANNELSGPCVATALAEWIMAQPHRRYTCRFVFAPETLGSIVYIARHLAHFKQKLEAGFVLSCVGDDRAYSYIPTRAGNTLADRAVKSAMRFHTERYTAYTFLERGSDERQYNAPGVDLPVCGICRTKYHEYEEYHTSADDLSLISPDGLQGAYNVCRAIYFACEHNARYRTACLCEPQLGKRGLYPNTSCKGSARAVKTMMDFLAYADGTLDLLAIADIIGAPCEELAPIAKTLCSAGVMVCAEEEL